MKTFKQIMLKIFVISVCVTLIFMLVFATTHPRECYKACGFWMMILFGSQEMKDDFVKVTVHETFKIRLNEKTEE